MKFLLLTGLTLALGLAACSNESDSDSSDVNQGKVIQKGSTYTKNVSELLKVGDEIQIGLIQNRLKPLGVGYTLQLRATERVNSYLIYIGVPGFGKNDLVRFDGVETLKIKAIKDMYEGLSIELETEVGSMSLYIILNHPKDEFNKDGVRFTDLSTEQKIQDISSRLESLDLKVIRSAK